jgi:hypothetical protein
MTDEQDRDKLGSRCHHGIDWRRNLLIRCRWSSLPVEQNDRVHEFMARFSGNPAKTAVSTVRPMPARSVTNDSQRIAPLPGENSQPGAVEGVTKSEISFGMAAPFTGSAKELGHQIKVGIEAAFNLVNLPSSWNR